MLIDYVRRILWPGIWLFKVFHYPRYGQWKVILVGSISSSLEFVLPFYKTMKKVELIFFL